MNKYNYSILIILLAILSLIFITGCGKLLTDSSAIAILSRSPTIGATSVSSTESLVITFSKAMNTNISLQYYIQLVIIRMIFCILVKIWKTFKVLTSTDLLTIHSLLYLVVIR